MVKSRIVDLPGIGEVLFEPSTRAGRINIAVKPFEAVRVAVPAGVSFKKAKKAAESKVDWIKAQQAKTKKIEKNHEELINNSGFISRATAKGIITGRLEELARQHGFKYNKVFIRNQKTRWGSCSSLKNLSLNYKIALLPARLMDYILLHELVHTRHPHHGRQFWDELARIVGDAKALDRELNEYSHFLVKA
ncbi:MAG: M48 family metallopeptidase [Desulfobacterales bacterium]